MLLMLMLVIQTPISIIIREMLLRISHGRDIRHENMVTIERNHLSR